MVHRTLFIHYKLFIDKLNRNIDIEHQLNK